MPRKAASYSLYFVRDVLAPIVDLETIRMLIRRVQGDKSHNMTFRQ